LFSNLDLSFVDAFFESMSGITTTGSTIIGDLNNAPIAILMWRSTLQWLGGIGIVIMAITVMPLLNVGGMQLFKMESGDTTEKILPKTREIAFNIVSIYFFLSAACAIAYFFSGMNIFDSIAHAMTTIATGGFSTYNESIGYFQNPKIEIVSIIFIILGSIPFIAYLKYLDGNKKIFFQDIQIKGFFAGPSLALVSAILYGIWSYTGYYAIILLAGLSIIPNDLYEAAKVEGASRWQTFSKITIPLLMPIIFFLLLTGFINTFQAFNHIYVMQTSSAGDTMDVVTIEIFDHFWDRVKFGYAAAEGVVLFILLNVLAISQFIFFRKRLNYD